MRRPILLITPALVALAACGGGSAETASTSTSTSTVSAPAPGVEATPSSSASASESVEPSVESSMPAPAGGRFVDVVDAALAPYATLIGSSAASAGIASALASFDPDVPLPAGSIVGAARIVEEWGDTLESVQSIGLDAAPGKEGLEEYGAAAPAGWDYNSISTTDSSSTLVMTRQSDSLRIVYLSSTDPDSGAPPAEFRLEADSAEMPQPAWLSALPVPQGGDLTAVGEGVGQVQVAYVPAGSGLATATWRFPGEQLTALQEFYAGGALETAGFTLVDPDAITVGASYFDVTAGDWTGQVIVGETIDGEESFASVQWLLTRA